MKDTEPLSPRAPPRLEKMERTLAADRLRLSVRISTISPTPPGPETLVADLLHQVGFAAGGFFDGALDIVPGHGFGAGVGDGQAEARVCGRVGDAALGRDGDVAGKLGEQLGALLVLRAFAELDVLEFRVAGHGVRFVVCGVSLRGSLLAPARV